MAPNESKRSILLVTNDLGPHAGGIETFLLGLISNLDGNDIAIFTSKAAGSEKFDRDLEAKTGVLVIRDKSKTLLPTPRVTNAVLDLAKKHKSEIVWFGAAAPLAIMAKKLKSNGIRRTVAITHGHEVWWAKIPPFSFAMRKIGNGCDVITYLGSFTHNSIKKALGTHPQLINIAPGISIDEFKPADKPRDLVEKYQLGSSPVIVCVGRLVKRKGQDNLIKAMSKILQEVPNAKLILVGQGKFENSLRNLVKKLKIDNSVTFVGRVPHSELPKYFLLGDVFAMPSRSRLFGLVVEGLGIVYLEASASGLPVIAGDSGGASDAVLIGKTGYLVDGRNVNEISSSAIKLLKDLPAAKLMGRNGRDWAESNWTWKMWGQKFSEILKG